MTEQGLIDYVAMYGDYPEWWYEQKAEREALAAPYKDDARGGEMKHSVSYHVEADFHNGEGWKRNGQQHTSPDVAELMARHFRRIADVRIVKVEVIETVVSDERKESC